jgi:hypothetical protein
VVDWSQIIVAIIGSSLVGFLLTNGLIEYNQPKIRIDADERQHPAFPSEKRFDMSIINEGLSAATNLRITLHYPSGNITNYSFVLEGENATSSVDSQAQSTLAISVPRFASSGVLLINTIVNDSKAPFYVDRNEIEYRCSEPNSSRTDCTYSNYTGSYFASATYDQGGTQISTDYSQRAYQPIEKIVPFNLLVILVIIVALIALISMILYSLINTKGPLKINKGLLLKIGMVDLVVITSVLFYVIPSQLGPNQLGLSGFGIWIFLVAGLVVGITYLLVSAAERRQQSMSGALTSSHSS